MLTFESGVQKSRTTSKVPNLAQATLRVVSGEPPPPPHRVALLGVAKDPSMNVTIFSLKI